jgi:hemolysin D
MHLFMNRVRLYFSAWRQLISRYATLLRHAWRARKSLDGQHYHREEAMFLPAALALQRSPASPAPRVALWLICTFALLALIWSIIGKVDVVAIAVGKIVPSGRSKPIQAIETASILRIHVKEGDQVRAGDTLIELDATATTADKDRLENEMITAQLSALRARAILSAQHSGQLPTLTAADVSAARLADASRQLDGSFIEYRARLARLDADIDRRQAELVSIQTSIHKLEQVLTISTRRASDYLDLQQRGYVSHHAWLEKEQARLDQEGELATQRNRLTELRAALRETQGQRTTLIAESRRQWLDAAEEAQQKATSLRQELVKAAARDQHMRITAPTDGSLQQVAVNTIGGVVTPAQVLMLLVPKDAPVEVDAQLPNKDIGFVHAGQTVEVKVETFPYTRYGTVRGKVLHISSDAVADEKMGLTYLAKIQLDKSVMDVNGRDVPLQPGMAVTAEINTGKRRVIDYLLSPLMEHLSESLRER